MIEFPSFFIFNRDHEKIKSKNLESIFFHNLVISYNKSSEKIKMRDNGSFLSFYHTNEAFKNQLQFPNYPDHSLNYANTDYSLFSWGFYLRIDKENSNFSLVNDPFGIYPLFYCTDGSDFLISNDFDGMVKILAPVTLNIDGVYDYFLFNYTLKSNTLISEISRLRGFSTIMYEGGKLKITNAPISDLIFGTENCCSGSMAECLRRNIKLNIDDSKPVKLPLTGGFDSKVILSLLLSSKKGFTSFTFGKKDSADVVAASSIAEMYSLKHETLEMSDDFLSSIDCQIDNFLRFSPNAPMLDTLLYYQLIKEELPKSNYVSGIMGGEMIVGPVLISELITTKSAALLTTNLSSSEVLAGLSSHLADLKIFNRGRYKTRLESYTESLSVYLQRSGKNNLESVINFLLNETYANFFGVVFANLFSRHNIINPLVDLDFLRLLFNSKYRFTKPFSKAPLLHFNSRKLYIELIKSIEPSVLKSRMDRGYNLEDFMTWYKFYKPFLNYFKRHYIQSKNKTKIVSANYLSLLIDKAIRELPSSEVISLNIFDMQGILRLIGDVKTGTYSRVQKQTLLQLFLLSRFLDRYSAELQYEAI